MKIALIGNNYFGELLAKQLSEFDTKNSYIFYDTNAKNIDKIKFLLSILFIDTVYSISASLNDGGALNLALKFRKKIVQHFIGSDVLTAIEDFKHKRINKDLVVNSHYLCEVDWIKSELSTIDINANIASIAIYDKEVQHQLPDTFTVLTYMAKGKEEFYGMDDFMTLATAFSDVPFKIAGIDSYDKELPRNIELLGWVDMDKEFQNTVCFIRNAQHDGLAFSILEALGNGKIVLYNYQFPYVNYFENSDDIIEYIANAKKEFEAGKLEINYQAINFIKKEYSKNHVLGNLVKILTENGDK